MDSDDQLLNRIKVGDREALALIYGRYLPSVWRYVYARLRRDDQACRDVVSETFLAAIRDLTRGNVSVVSVGAWLTGIARHKLADWHRFAVRQVDMEPSAAPSLDGDPVLVLEAAETRRVVGCVMEQMDDVERIVLEWKYIEEWSVSEIARGLNRTDKAIEALLYRARNSFRALYDKTHGTNP